MNYKEFMCPHCNAALRVTGNEKYIICDYCDSRFQIEEDHSPNSVNSVKIHYVDEARLREAELKEKMFEAEMEEREQEKATAESRKSLGYGLLVLCVISLILIFRAFSGLLLIIFLVSLCGSISMLTDKKASQYSYRHRTASEKNKWVAFFLCFFLGIFGIHYFYVGRIGKGILYMVTGGLFGIGYFVDLIYIVSGNFKDSDGMKLI